MPRWASWVVWGWWAGALIASQPAQARTPSCEAPERVVLGNGIEVLLAAQPGLSTVAVVSSIHAGTRHDPPGHEGLATLVQRLTQRAAPPFASSWALYREAGAFDMGAVTDPDTTDYYAVLSAAQLERALWVEARRLALGLDALNEAAALAEREVLKRQHAWRFGKGPRHLLLQTVENSLHAPEHPYHSQLQTEKSLSRLTLADARAFFAEYYRPGRMRLVLLGGFDVARVKLLLERHLGSLPASSDARSEGLAQRECAAAQSAPTPAASRLVLVSTSQHEVFELYWPVARGDAERWRGLMSMLSIALSEAAEQSGISSEISVRLEQRELGAFWVLQVHLAPGQKFELAEPLVRSVLESLRTAPIDRRELLARQQAFELSEAVLENDLLQRARRLAKRQCAPAQCVSSAELLEPALLEQIERFTPERALVIERRFESTAPHEGSIERQK